MCQIEWGLVGLLQESTRKLCFPYSVCIRLSSSFNRIVSSCFAVEVDFASFPTSSLFCFFVFVLVCFFVFALPLLCSSASCFSACSILSFLHLLLLSFASIFLSFCFRFSVFFFAFPLLLFCCFPSAVLFLLSLVFSCYS